MNRALCATLVGAIIMLATGAAQADDFPGISVDPPDSAAWVQVQRNAASVVWMRRTDTPAVTFGAALLTQPMERAFASHEAFLDWVRARKETSPDPRRFRLLENHVASAGSGRETCARYRTVVEVRATEEDPGALLRLEVAGLACIHPDQPARYYDIQYSARMPAGEDLPPGLSREGEAFVDSARFRPAPADGDWSLGEGVPAPVRREAA